MDKSEEYKHTCSCGTDIRTTESEGGVLRHYLKCVTHLFGEPHKMGRPIHIRTTNSGHELFKDQKGTDLALIRKDE